MIKIKKPKKDFEEEFTSEENLKRHYDKHIKQNKEYNWTKEEYDKYSDILSKTPCDYKKIFGYAERDRRSGDECYVKYDKELELFITYVINKTRGPLVITAYRKTWREFQSDMYGDEIYEYIGEIPKGL